jgi:RsiW-degrading membrane proteinase PrsW (M82 family)
MDIGSTATQRETEEALTPPRSHWLYILALIAGLTAMAMGALVGGLFVLLSLRGMETANRLSMTTIGVSIAASGLGLGGALAWTGYQGLRNRSSRTFRPGANWILACLVGLALALLIGQLILALDLLAPLTFPLFHVLGMALPPITILVVIGGGLRYSTPATTGRQVIGQLVWGAFGTTAIAFTLEAVLVVVGLIAIGIAIGLRPGGLAQLAELQAMLEDAAQLQDPQLLVRWLLRPEIVLSIGILLTIVVPLIEEGAKSVGVPLLALGTGRKPSPAQGWLWGIAAGAGFAITEGLFNSAASLPFWAGIALLRVGATAMHMVTAGLTGLGWAHTLASRRPLPFLGSYLASVTLHGVWNGLTVLIVISSLWMMAQPGDPVGMIGGGSGILVGLTGLILLTATIIGVASYITLRLRRGREGYRPD